MRPSILLGVLVSVISLSVTALQSSLWAQSTTPSVPTAPPAPTTSQGPNTGSSTLQQATGQLKTDTSKTKQDVKDLDVMKSTQDVSDVKKDVQNVEDSAKGLLTNPFGK